MQQVKGNKEEDPDSALFREAFCVSNPNRTLIVADYSSQEARVMADLANDESYIDFFKNGDGDAHSFVATKAFSASFGKEFIVTKHNENKAYRQKGKILNFSISFGAGAWTIAKKLKIEKSEGQNLIDSFYKAFPALKKFFDEAGQFGLQRGYIFTNTVTNRIRWIPEWQPYIKLKEKRFRTKEEDKEFKKLEGLIKRKSQNTRIQGTAADISKTALILLRKKLLEEGIRPLTNAKVKIVNIIHDEAVCESRKELSDYWAIQLKDSMEKAAKVFCKLEIPAEPKISSFWSH
jgi:DNA polymerase-1